MTCDKADLKAHTTHVHGCQQDAQLSQTDRTAEYVIVLAKSGRLELEYNILWKL